MSSKLKRVKFSIYLDPLHSNSDMYVFELMKKWALEQNDLVENPSTGLELHEKLHKHKGIYLAGLYLHLLSPALANLLSSDLLPGNISMGVLSKKLDACGLTLADHQSKDNTADISSDLKMLFEEHFSQLGEMVKSSQHHANEDQSIFLEQKKEIAELKSLLLAQNQMLRSLQANAGNISTALPEALPIEQDLNKAIAGVKKIKKKGLF